MSDFDIRSLLEFNPPRIICENCRALLPSLSMDKDRTFCFCPICKIRYLPTEELSVWEYENYFKTFSLSIDIPDLLGQGQKFAWIADDFRRKGSPPLYSLLRAMSTAKSFVHFVSFGLGFQLYGALKMASMKVPIRGIVSNINASFAKEIKDTQKEAPNLELLIFERTNDPDDWKKVPHQKLVVIDGLIAFKGASNMTENGWRKSAEGTDYVEVVTNIKEVVELHNSLISTLWAKQKRCSDPIAMYKVPF